MCVRLSFALRSCLEDKNPQVHTVTVHLVCSFRDEEGEMKTGGIETRRERWDGGMEEKRNRKWGKV